MLFFSHHWLYKSLDHVRSSLDDALVQYEPWWIKRERILGIEVIRGLVDLIGSKHSDRVWHAVTVGDELLKKHASVFEEAFSRIALLLLPSPEFHHRTMITFWGRERSFTWLEKQRWGWFFFCKGKFCRKYNNQHILKADRILFFNYYFLYISIIFAFEPSSSFSYEDVFRVFQQNFPFEPSSSFLRKKLYPDKHFFLYSNQKRDCLINTTKRKKNSKTNQRLQFHKKQVILENFIKLCNDKSNHLLIIHQQTSAITYFSWIVYAQNRGGLLENWHVLIKRKKTLRNLYTSDTLDERQSGLINGEWSPKLPQIVRILFWIWISGLSFVHRQR